MRIANPSLMVALTGDHSPPCGRSTAMRIARVLCWFLLLAAPVAAGAIGPADVLVWRDVAYAEPGLPKQKLDIYAPAGARRLPVVFWIHGGGWQAGDKSAVNSKPRAFADRGFVFVSINYRLLPEVDMGTIVRDCARAAGWTRDHIAEYGGDPQRLLIMGHSAGAQLAALLCTDERYLKAEGVPLAHVRGCAPVDGDTYDVPLIIETARARRRSLGQPEPRFGHFEKFGGDPAKHRDFSAVNHVAVGKGIPPFLLLHVADHPDTTQQALRLRDVLREAGLPADNFAAADTDHVKLDVDLGLPGDPASAALFAFAHQAVRR
jgi:arylformamidase